MLFRSGVGGRHVFILSKEKCSIQSLFLHGSIISRKENCCWISPIPANRMLLVLINNNNDIVDKNNIGEYTEIIKTNNKK